MNKQEFIIKMKNDVLFTENELTFDMPLDKIPEWDSLGFVSFIAMAKESGHSQVNRNTINEAKTLGDLFVLVK